MAEPYIAQIYLFAGNFPIRGYANCTGQILSISQNAALFSILGTTYGGDGRTTFALPDLRGRMAMQPGTGPGLPNYSLGQKGGVFQTTLSTNQIPAHSHSCAMPCENQANGDTFDPQNAVPSVVEDKPQLYSTISDSNMLATNTSSVGGNQAVSTQSPFLGINFQIALVGLFPPRN